MLDVAKAFFLIASLAASATAATSRNADACLVGQDEVSLLQLDQQLKPASEAKPASQEDYFPLADGGSFVAEAALDGSVGATGFASGVIAKADADPNVRRKAVEMAVPDGIDHGAVHDAFAVNELKLRDGIALKAQKNIDEVKKVKQERLRNRMEAEASVRHDQQLLAKALADDRASVAATAKQRAETVAHAVNRVRVAKEKKIAHAIKRQQAMKAAVLGRVIGAKEGMAEARRLNWVAKAKELEQVALFRRKQSKMLAARRVALAKAGTNAVTERMAMNDRLGVAAFHRKMAATRVASAAKAAQTKEAIEGPEGLNNALITHFADRAVKDYQRMTAYEQEKTDLAADAVVPLDWPLGSV